MGSGGAYSPDLVCLIYTGQVSRGGRFLGDDGDKAVAYKWVDVQ